jgi:hypothetical protein
MYAAINVGWCSDDGSHKEGDYYGRVDISFENGKKVYTGANIEMTYHYFTGLIMNGTESDGVGSMSSASSSNTSSSSHASSSASSSSQSSSSSSSSSSTWGYPAAGFGGRVESGYHTESQNYTLKLLGCYKAAGDPKPFPEELPTDIGSKMKTVYKKDMTDLIMQCAEKTKNRGYTSFGIQDWVKCVSGRDESRYNEQGEAAKSTCINQDGLECEHGEWCVGTKDTMYTYVLVTDKHKDVQYNGDENKRKRSLSDKKIRRSNVFYKLRHKKRSSRLHKVFKRHVLLSGQKEYRKMFLL